MKNHNFLSIILLYFFLVSCGHSEKDAASYFSFNTSSFKEQYRPSDTLTLEILNAQNKKIDSVIYYMNDVKIGSKKGLEKVSLDFSSKKLGYQNLKSLVYFEGENVETTARVELVSDVEPKLLTYKIINTFPHDTTSYTEGLEFYRDTLYESGGQYNRSKLYKSDYRTGKVYKNINLDGKYFGEGITILNNKIFQLTWKELTGFVYNSDTWKVEKTFTFDKKIEGWGMTNDGKNLYQSDGTEKIWRMNPETQKMVDYINVYTNNSKIKSVNELEWINGKIYCNIYQKDAIAIVNPLNGAVEAILNMTDLRKQLKYPKSEVLNGIAYNAKTQTLFITGKYWDKMFEIKVVE
ncbi:glutaminyl-peptide cyclotransferase [Flavobacterium psychrotolerans]|uniref:Glutamine cyclotransferase n=1 Tax=Flavobacterium psychrotolerans TaxID=2169410 RepID=A0A2U1JMG5_9FLAO|nr:glutaminyl-peptide cyclotransferase [Flavobacterium psychrotolerans]PWA06195.1 glutamine cyclotransferase [Flavobacterium psychrotolerans]